MASNSLTRWDAGLTELNVFRDEELADAYRISVYGGFPCPSLLWDQLIKIARLRAMPASGASKAMLFESAKSIQEQIELFIPAKWEETYEIPEDQTAWLLASMFQAAASIYCCACLPKSAVGDDFIAWSSPIIAAQCTRLIHLLIKTVEVDKELLHNACWPLAVAGYAAQHGQYSQRAQVKRILTDMDYEFGGTPPQILQRVERFWLQPGDSWDHCWDRPFTFYP